MVEFAAYLKKQKGVLIPPDLFKGLVPNSILCDKSNVLVYCNVLVNRLPNFQLDLSSILYAFAVTSTKF